MTENTDNRDHEEFEQYFTVEHSLDIAVTPLPEDYDLPGISAFEETIPESFLMSAELSQLSMKSLMPLRGLSEHAEHLVDYLKLQSQKIDLMMHHILKKETPEQARRECTEFGGSGIRFVSDQAIIVGQYVELRIFITSESAAIYSIAKVIQCSPCDGSYAVTLLFKRIRPDDVDIIVKAALNLQAEDLKRRRQLRDQES